MDPLPVFVLGLTRSGKSTIERLLAAFPGVRRGYENSLIHYAVKTARQLSGRTTSRSLQSLPKRAYPEFSIIYAEQVRRWAGGTAVFTTTMPGLISHVPRLIVAVPRARFIFVKRDPDDLALRIFFKQYRRDKHVYAYSVPMIRSYMKFYNALIDCYLDKFADRTMLIRYEDLVIDPAGAAARLAAFCGIKDIPGTLPDIGNDVGCSAPYREKLAAAASKSG
jgi:hypothetical protein